MRLTVIYYLIHKAMRTDTKSGWRSTRRICRLMQADAAWQPYRSRACGIRKIFSIVNCFQGNWLPLPDPFYPFPHQVIGTLSKVKGFQSVENSIDLLKFSTRGLQTEKFEIPIFVKIMMSPRSRKKMLGTRNKQNQNLKNWIFERSRSARGIPTKQTSESVNTRSHNQGQSPEVPDYGSCQDQSKWPM